MGLSLDAVREHIPNRTPENTLDLFETQIKALSAKIDDLLQLRESIEKRAETIRLHKDIKAPLFTIEVRSTETIFIGRLCASAPNLDVAYFHSFLKQCREVGISHATQIGQIVFMELALAGSWDAAGCMYAKTNKGSDNIEEGMFDDNHAYYEKFMRHVSKNSLELRGNIYIEYPLDEMSENDPKKHLVKIFSPVRQR